MADKNKVESIPSGYLYTTPGFITDDMVKKDWREPEKPKTKEELDVIMRKRLELRNMKVMMEELQSERMTPDQIQREEQRRLETILPHVNWYKDEPKDIDYPPIDYTNPKEGMDKMVDKIPLKVITLDEKT